ncbi:metallophosphoesterase [Virgibacillus sp. 179-BFC.A HS]|uniref:Phosphoesterase n=1 Tax=Tigheibacillus jepli TaxID=3035914 RepID=A0ABU5CGH9_9BACI|nr:metallophosphoesterase [Virgibacillus sp. 179-BFC.A HS]MDY0405426.1 metallophosphoesterase [Virgibacillus sp. 179-BFC.A HS]
MHKVLVLSDSHGLKDQLLQIKNRHQVEQMIHCGDSELDMDDEAMAGFLKVRGNCDDDVRYPLEEIFTIADITFFVAHGHLLDVKSNLTRLSYRAEEEGASIVCFGHTHIAGAEKIGDQIFINPGSIRLPKGRQEKTYAIVQWDKRKSGVEVNFYTVDGEEVKELSGRFSF